MPRRRLLPAVAAVLALTATAACGTGGGGGTPLADSSAAAPVGLVDRAPVATEAELAESPTAQAIKRRGQLLVGGELNMPLLSEQNSITGQTEGFDATLGKMLAKYIIGEPNVQVVQSTPETREAVLQTGTVDAVIRIYTITPQRAEKVAFAGPYLISGQSIATLRSESRIGKVEDLAGRDVAALAGSTSADAVERQVPTAKLTTFGTPAECVQALETGRVDAYVHDLTVLAGAARLNDKIQIVGQPFTSDPYGIGIRRGDDAFKRFVNTWLQKIEQAGIWEQAWRDSLGTVVAGQPPSPPVIGSVPGS
ncbi:glutamate ABC transporter substrate-binding protein [Amycolatopsis suaedae]|uniref:Glutamate ABC transporter substrate-binding protein n=1 Tax=Amycolatopsis suaedae TaxID=2510978 RepID=A0A4Q7J1R0_9PSEU|nr:glutamate ABC transporter substrate-binding protein [Amycolatopsis suaedae]RZQ60333.1 glutamate ABC transporter substrate-binding protein [Amycolatopsis suaedae]